MHAASKSCFGFHPVLIHQTPVRQGATHGSPATIYLSPSKTAIGHSDSGIHLSIYNNLNKNDMKTFQRFLGIALTMLLMAAFPSTAAAYTSAQITAMQDTLSKYSSYTVIFFDKSSSTSSSSWSDVGCHYWQSSNTSNTTAWPGEDMTLIDGTTIYFYVFPSDLGYTPDKVMFTDNVQDTSNKTDSNGFTIANGTLYDYSGVVSLVSALNADDAEEEEEETTATTTYTYTVTFDTSTYSITNGWGTQVYCYIYDGSTEYTDAWNTSTTGSAMTNTSGTVWTYTFTTTDELSSSAVIIFNNGSGGEGSNQTSNLSFSTYLTSKTSSTDNDDDDDSGSGGSGSGDTGSGSSSSTVTSTIPSAGLYLVAHDGYGFFATEKEDSAFQYSFKLTQQTDGTYSIMLPATLEGVRFSLVVADGSGNNTYYGNASSFYNFTSSSPAAVATAHSTASVNGNIIGDESQSYYWCLYEAHSNTKLYDGTYTFAVTLNDGEPNSWTMTHQNDLRVAYFVRNPDEHPNPVMQVAEMYSAENVTDGNFNNNYFGYFYLEAGEHGYVVSNVSRYDADNSNMLTTTKLYSQGNYNEGAILLAGSENQNNLTGNVIPTYGYGTGYDGFILSETQNIATTLEYNPTGYDWFTDCTVTDGSVSRTFRGRLYKSTSGTALTDVESVNIIGTVANGTWDASRSMSYDLVNNCYTITLTTTATEGTEYFRFIESGTSGDDWSTNWEDDGVNTGENVDKAKVPYNDTTDETKLGHTAKEDDPNYVELNSTTSATTRTEANDIIFNRPAGVWTIKFYIVTTTSVASRSYLLKLRVQ